VVSDWLANSNGSFDTTPATLVPLSADWKATPGLLFVN
jgi:hypothetical protein